MSDRHTPGSLGEPFDRRAANREAVDWVRIALREQKEATADLRDHVLKIEDTVEEVKVDLLAHMERSLNSVPNRDPIQHLNDHQLIAQEREERKRAEERAKERKEEIVWSGIKYALGAAAIFIATLMGAGAQSYFKGWLGVPESAPQTIKDEK